MRWHAHFKPGGTGHLYQGRFKSFPIQTDGHLLTVMRYVERNPVRADFVELAEDWQWSSAYARAQRADERRWLAIPDDPRLPRIWQTGVHG
jgi:putative transposase